MDRNQMPFMEFSRFLVGLTFGAESATLRILLPDPEPTTSSFKIQASASRGSKGGFPINTGALVEVKKQLSQACPQEIESRPETTYHTLRTNLTANRDVAHVIFSIYTNKIS